MRGPVPAIAIATLLILNTQVNGADQTHNYTPSELAALAPKFDSRDSAIKTLHILACADPTAPLFGYELYFDRSGTESLLVSDSGDGTPLLLCTHRRGMMDP